MKPSEVQVVRPVVGWVLAICLGMAMAPWMSGGQGPVVMFVSASALLVGLALAWLQPAVKVLKQGPLVWSYLAFVGWGALSLFWTANRYSTALWLVVMLMAGLAFRLSYVVAGQERGRGRLVSVYLVSAAACLAYGFWFYLTVPYGRFVGPFYWPNVMAIYLVPAILLAIYGLRRRDKWAWGWWGFLALAGAAFWLADSRASTLVLLIVAGAYLLVERLDRRRWLMLIAGVVVSLVLSNLLVRLQQTLIPVQQKATAVVGAAIPGTRYKELISGGSQSGSDRWWYLKSAGEMWWDNPAGGVGAGAYGDVHPKYQGRVVSAGVSAHNFYVQTLGELGIAGVILLAWLMLSIIAGVVRGLMSGRSESVVLALGLAALIVHMGMDVDSRYPALVLLTAVMAGIVYGQGRPLWRRLSWRPLVGAVVAVVLTVSIYRSAGWAEQGRKSQAAGDYAAAAEAFREAQRSLVYDPDVVGAEAINLYTLSVSESKDAAARSRRALEQARRAERLDPADAQHHQVEAWVLSSRDDLNGAASALERALQLDPYNYPAYATDLAKIRILQNRPDEALRVARQMLQQYPEQVIANRSIDTTLKPSLAELWALAGELEFKKGNVAAARKAAEAASWLDPKNRGLRRLQKAVDAVADTITP